MIHLNQRPLGAAFANIEDGGFMFLSQIKTVVHGMVLGSLLSLSFPVSALAGTNKKGLTGAGSTQAQVAAAGGVSDGGGNAVGLQLFDFYENEGTQKITIKELVALEPLTEVILSRLSKEILAIKYKEYSPFGEMLKEYLQGKAIYLESKEIKSSGCTNQSMVATQDQKTVGCQDDMEVRLYLPWLRTTDAQNRAGLIVHELLLGWARAEFSNLTKEEVEQRVRILNRMIFEGENIADTLGGYGLYVYTPATMKFIASAQKDFPKFGMEFCKNPWMDFNAAMTKYTDNDMVYRELPGSDVVDLMLLSSKVQNLKGLKGNEYHEQRAYVMAAHEKMCAKMKALYWNN